MDVRGRGPRVPSIRAHRAVGPPGSAGANAGDPMCIRASTFHQQEDARGRGRDGDADRGERLRRDARERCREVTTERDETGDVEGVADEGDLEQRTEVLTGESRAVEPKLEQAEQRPLARSVQAAER